MIKRRAFVSMFAILVASLVAFFFNHAEFYWLPLATFVVLQTPAGFTVRPALMILAIMASAILITGALAWLGTPVWLHGLSIALVVVTSCYVYFLVRLSTHFTKYLLLLFPLSFVLAALANIYSPELIKDRCLDIVSGIVLGLAFSHIFFKTNSAKLFKRDLLPIINCLSEASELLANDFAEKNIFPIKLHDNFCSQMLKLQCRKFPEWIYATGFNPGLRAGMRFFFIHVERVAEIFYAIDVIVKQPVDAENWVALSPTLSIAMQRNNDLLEILQTLLLGKQPLGLHENFTSDIMELEHQLHAILPKQMELVDLKSHNLLLLALVREIKDMRNALLQLTLILQKANL